MLPRKPYLKKPISWSERDYAVLKDVRGYVIWVFKNDGANVIRLEARVQDPGQCAAALVHAKEHNERCLVYAIGESYGEPCLCLVDVDFLRGKIQ